VALVRGIKTGFLSAENAANTRVGRYLRGAIKNIGGVRPAATRFPTQPIACDGRNCTVSTFSITLLVTQGRIVAVDITGVLQNKTHHSNLYSNSLAN
jgi:hypothetical protein